MKSGRKWLLLLYAIPARFGTSRVGVWRQVKKSGAIALKSSTYVLPDLPPHLERFQWLAQEVRDSGGEATLIHATEIEGLTEAELVEMFNSARAEEYRALTDDLNDLMALNKHKKSESFTSELERLAARLEEIARVDWFDSPKAQDAHMRLQQARALHGKREKSLPKLSPRNFVARTWLTRPRPEVDRVGSSWLIRHFIDPKATFVFSNQSADFPDALPFDMANVEFSHHGEDCTFETLVKRFGLADPRLRRIGEMVHVADLEDDKFPHQECIGIDRVLKGWGRLGVSDQQLLERGGECFDALYEYLRKKA